ncbi:unnamed protein product, partial [Gadus morhua 'NCC']
MEDHGYYRSYVQCRDKLKKLKSDYKAIKDQNGRSGSNRKSWKWYDQMDTIYGHRPANNGRESGIDSAMGLLEEIDNDDFLCTTEEGGLVNIDSDEPPAAASTPPPPTPTEPPSPTSSTTETPSPRHDSDWPEGLQQLMENWPTVTSGKLGKTEVEKHAIFLQDEVPVRSKAYR